jgi:hypothetical protein
MRNYTQEMLQGCGMINLTQTEIEMIVSLAIAVISIATNQAGAAKLGDTILNRVFAIIFLLAICGVSYHTYLASRDLVFAAIAIIATLLLLFFFVLLAARRK